MKDQDLVKPDGIDRVIDYLVGNYGEIQRAWKKVAPEDQTLEKYPAWALRHLLRSPWSRRFGKEDKHLIMKTLPLLDDQIQVAGFLDQFHQDPEWDRAYRIDCGRWLKGFPPSYHYPPDNCWDLRQAFFSTEAFMLALEKIS